MLWQLLESLHVIAYTRTNVHAKWQYNFRAAWKFAYKCEEMLSKFKCKWTQVHASCMQTDRKLVTNFHTSWLEAPFVRPINCVYFGKQPKGSFLTATIFALFCALPFLWPAMTGLGGGYNATTLSNAPTWNPHSNPDIDPHSNPNPSGLLDCCDWRSSRSLCAEKDYRSLSLPRHYSRPQCLKIL